MRCEVACVDDGADWARGARTSIIWWLPAAVLLISPLIGTRYLTVVWPGLLTLMGMACLLNARRCGRVHCFVTGPFFLLLALVALMHALDVLPLGAKGWWTLSVVLVIGGAALIVVPESLFGHYRPSKPVAPSDSAS